MVGSAEPGYRESGTLGGVTQLVRIAVTGRCAVTLPRRARAIARLSDGAQK